MNEGNFFKPSNNEVKEPIKIESTLDLKINKLVDCQKEIQIIAVK